MGKTDCKNHEGHLCTIAKKGKLKKMQKLVKKPAFICKKCARVADCAENLCNPKAYS